MNATLPRPTRLIGVLGAGTDVGKTWATARLMQLLQARGVRVAARKPVQSFDPDAHDTDAHRLAAASGEAPEHVCSPDRWYPLALAPPMAADQLDRGPIALGDLIREVAWPANLDVGFIETAGGARSPVAHDGDSIDLLRRVEVDEILLVADANLGALNSIRLTLACTGGIRTRVFLNRYDDSQLVHRLNFAWLRERYSVDAFTSLEEWR